jgi:O-antigen/teichoic acid export membrane protein
MAALVPIVIGFFLMPVIVNKIGATAYGIWLLANSVVGYMGIIDLGLGPTVTKKTAEYLAIRADDKLNQVLSTAFSLYLALGLVIATLVLVLAQIIPFLFHTDAQQGPQLKLVLLIIGMQAAAGFPFSIFGGMISGLQDFHIRSILTVANAIFRLTGTVIVLSLGFGLISLLILEFGLSGISWAFQVFWIKKRVPHLKLHPKLYDRGEMKQLFKFTGAMLLWRVAGLTIHRANRIIIAMFMPVANVTLFEIGTKTAEWPRTGVWSFLSPLLPACSELNAQRESESIKEVYLTGTKFILAFYLATGGALFCWGAEFISLWMGKQFAAAVSLMYILLLGNVYQAQNVVAHVMLAGMGVLKAFTRVMASYPVVNLILAITLTKMFGLLGIARAVTLTFIIVETYLTTQVLRVFRVSFRDLVLSCYLPSLISIVPAATSAYVLHQVMAVNSWERLAAVTATFLGMFAATFWFVGVSEGEKRSLQANLYAFVRPLVTRV